MRGGQQSDRRDRKRNDDRNDRGMEKSYSRDREKYQTKRSRDGSVLRSERKDMSHRRQVDHKDQNVSRSQKREG